MESRDEVTVALALCLLNILTGVCHEVAAVQLLASACRSMNSAVRRVWTLRKVCNTCYGKHANLEGHCEGHCPWGIEVDFTVSEVLGQVPSQVIRAINFRSNCAIF